MNFKFIRYTQPGWKFNVVPKAKKFAACLYHPTILPLKENILIEPDNHYETEAAQNADIAYRAFYKGILQEATQEQLTQINQLGSPSLKDEYIFIKKYWGKPWLLFAFVRRLFSFHNPIKEFNAFSNALSIKKYPLNKNHVSYNAYQQFQSALIKQQPLVSVIIPTLNRYEYLKDVMLDLEKQHYKNFDVIVVDQSEPFNAAFYQSFKLNLKVIEQKEKLLWTARNKAIKTSTADYLLFFDDDSRVEPDWIEQHLKTLDFFNADISAGVSIAVMGGKIPESYNYFRWADQFDSGNALVKRSVFKDIGLFDLQFNKQSMGDGEFGIRAFINGYKSISNHLAKRVHLKVSAGGLREIGHWDGFRPKKLFAPKPIPSVIYLYNTYYPKPLNKDVVLLGIMLSNVHYAKKRGNNMMLRSVILTFLKSPLLFIQYQRAKNKAKKMQQEGAKIEKLSCD